MSGDVNMRRSQAILRLPVDSVLASLTLHDGERSDVLLFIAAGEDVSRLLGPGDPFVPMIRNARFCLVARAAIAAIAIVTGPVVDDDGALPVEHQRARVRLRSGVAIEGELQWTAPEGERRTADYLNDGEALFQIHAVQPATIHYIAKAHVATVEELE
jgi:hypothetical protein